MLSYLYYSSNLHVELPELFQTLIPNNYQTPFELSSYPTGKNKADQMFFRQT